MRFNKKIFYSILVLLFLSFLVYWRWLFGGVFTSSDWGFGYAGTMKEYLNISPWFEWGNLGSVNYLLWRLPTNCLYGVIGALGYGSALSDKLFVFFPTLILGNLGIFLLTRKITRSSLAGFIAAIVFNYNTYIFISSNAFLLYSAAAWSILTLYIFIHALEKDKLYLFLLSTLTLFVTGSYDFRIVYVTIFILTLYFTFFNFFIESYNKKLFIKRFAFFSIQGLLFILLNVYWVLPTLGSNSLVTNTILDRGLFGNEFLNILYAVSFYHPFWTGGIPAAFHPQQIKFYFWLIPIFAFLGLYLNKKNKNIIFFGIVALIGIFLTKQVGIPFNHVYQWLFENLPGFSAFREASKFYFLISLGYSVLIGAFIAFVINKFKKGETTKYGGFLLSVLIAVIFLSNTIPVLTGLFEGIYTPSHIPQDYLVLKNYIEKDNSFYRTLWVPAFSRWGISENSHPEINGIDITYNAWNKYIKKYQNQNIVYQGQLITQLFYEKDVNNLLNNSSVKLVIVPIEDKANNDDFFVYYGKNRNYYVQKLDKISYLHKVNIGTKNLVIYENEDFKPHIYITNEEDTINKNVDYKKVNFTSISPSEYNINLKNVTRPIYLNFSDAYSTQWDLRVGEFNWFDALIKKNYFVSDKYHFQTDASLNSFRVDPNTICKEFSCQKKPDGSYDINLTLYFSPISYLYLGLGISIITFVFIIIYLIFILSKNLYEKRS